MAKAPAPSAGGGKKPTGGIFSKKPTVVVKPHQPRHGQNNDRGKSPISATNYKPGHGKNPTEVNGGGDEVVSVI